MNNLGRGSENNKKDKERIFTRETMGIVLVLFAILAFVFLITRDVVFGSVGFAISSFLLGAFGYCSYAVLAALVYAGIVLLTGKRITASRKTVWLCVLLFVCLVCLVHTITSAVSDLPYTGYGEYLSACYKAGENSFFSTTGGGVIIGLIVYPVVKLITPIGGYIVFSLLTVGAAYLIYATRRTAVSKRHDKKTAQVADAGMRAATENTSGLYDLNYAAPNEQAEQIAQEQASVREDGYMHPYPTANAEQGENSVERSKRLYAVGDDFNFKTKREMRQETRQEARRAQEQSVTVQPMTPYAQSHSILYPERAGNAQYNWYEERFGGGSSSAPTLPKSPAADAPYSSYTNNRIFDKDSYFNRPDRGAISREQYSDCFRTPAKSGMSEGHELSKPRTQPAAAEPEKKADAPTYSQMYADEAENNISYSNRPKKIVTDATHADSASQAREDFYRQDVQTDYSEGFSRRTPEGEKEAETSRNSFTSATEKQPDAPSVDASEAARRAGFGGMDMHRGSSSEEPYSRRMTSESSSRSEGIGFRDDGARFGSSRHGEMPEERSSRLLDERSGEIPQDRSPRLQSERGQDAAAERSSRLSDEQDVERRDRTRLQGGQNEEKSGLQPISEDFDSAVNLFDDEEEEPADSSVPDAMERVSRREDMPTERRAAAERLPQKSETEQPRPKHIYARYNAPSLDLLRDYQSLLSQDADDLEHNKDVIVETLSNLKIPSEVVKVTQGPAVTRYDIDIPGNIPTSRVLSCDKELAMRLHAKDGVNIQTNYENGSISIEVPNKQRATVGLKEIIRNEKFVNSKPGALMFGLGKDIEGKAICGDIMKMKHLLVAGSTGSGKSVCLNALIISLLYKYSPEDLRIILVDPKQVEFNIYEKLPHLMINEIIFEPSKVINVLNWAITEMERRYGLFKEKTKKGTLVREIDEYNAHLLPEEEKLPKIVMIIDELADLMLAAKKEIEDRIQRLTQKSRAAGIHLVLATQRPSVNVITGVIKSNLPTRIAFKVTQEVDSRTILDESGAEKLLGYGDMLYKTDTMTFPFRVQGAFLSSEEVQNVVQYVKEHNEAYFDERVYDFIHNDKGSGGGGGGDGDDSVEAVYIDALRHVVQIGQASISMIQRRCSVGYPKAGKIIEWMENMGYISAFDGAKARKVLLTQEEFDSKYGDYGE